MDVMDGVTPQWVKEITGVDLLWIDFFPFILPSTLPFKELLTRWLRDDDDAFKLASVSRTRQHPVDGAEEFRRALPSFWNDARRRPPWPHGCSRQARHGQGEPGWLALTH